MVEIEMQLLLTLWRVAAYFLPGLPSPTINQGSFCLGFVGSAAPEEFRMDMRDILEGEEGTEIMGFEKRHQGKLILDTEQAPTFIILIPSTGFDSMIRKGKP